MSDSLEIDLTEERGGLPVLMVEQNASDLHLQVGQAGDGRQPRAQGFRLAPQRVQVVAKELDGNLRAHARQHVVDSMAQRLSYCIGNARNAGKCGTNIG